jgi:hypothetical protein
MARPLPAYGSMAAHDSLVAAYVVWRLAQEACEGRPDDAMEAALADEAWAELKRHSGNCGWAAETHGPLSAWAPRRVNAYANSLQMRV